MVQMFKRDGRWLTLKQLRDSQKKNDNNEDDQIPSTTIDEFDKMSFEELQSMAKLYKVNGWALYKDRTKLINKLFNKMMSEK
jgi:hypothetical protein